MMQSEIILLYPAENERKSIQSVRVWHYTVNRCKCKITNTMVEEIDSLFAEYYNNVNDFGLACNRMAALEYIRMYLKKRKVLIPDQTLDEIMHHFLNAVKKWGGAIEEDTI